MEKILMMNGKDNVAICLNEIREGTTVLISEKKGVDKEQITVVSNVPFAHKIALSDIAKSELVIKYGEIIGRATCSIKKGEWIHIHNIESTRARGDLSND